MSTITPAPYGGYDIEDPLTTENSDKFISTEGCFSCKVIKGENRQMSNVCDKLKFVVRRLELRVDQDVEDDQHTENTIT